LPETKKQKPNRRLLVIGKYRILSIVRKKLGGHKISRNFHLLELVEINQQERDKVVSPLLSFARAPVSCARAVVFDLIVLRAGCVHLRGGERQEAAARRHDALRRSRTRDHLLLAHRYQRPLPASHACFVCAERPALTVTASAYLRITCGFPADYGFTLRAPSALYAPHACLILFP
jgi:hypothetical protein